MAIYMVAGLSVSWKQRQKHAFTDYEFCWCVIIHDIIQVPREIEKHCLGNIENCINNITKRKRDTRREEN